MWKQKNKNKTFYKCESSVYYRKDWPPKPMYNCINSDVSTDREGVGLDETNWIPSDITSQGEYLLSYYDHQTRDIQVATIDKGTSLLKWASSLITRRSI